MYLHIPAGHWEMTHNGRHPSDNDRSLGRHVRKGGNLTMEGEDDTCGLCFIRYTTLQKTNHVYHRRSRTNV